MKTNMLKAIADVNPESCEEFKTTKANYFMLQNFISDHNAKVTKDNPMLT